MPNFKLIRRFLHIVLSPEREESESESESEDETLREDENSDYRKTVQDTSMKLGMSN